MPFRQSNHPLNRLVVRLPLVLSLVLMPIGFIAVVQTYQVSTEVKQRARSTLTAMTSEAVVAEREIIQEAFGTGQGIAGYIETVRPDPEACSLLMKRVTERNPNYSFIAYIPTSGEITCSSADGPVTISDSAEFDAAMERGVPEAFVDMNPIVSEGSVISAVTPVRSLNGAAPIGYVTVAVPHDAISPSDADEGTLETHPIEIFTFNKEGQLLTASLGLENAESRLPQNRALINLVGSDTTTFSDTDASGIERLYAVVPVADGKVYALGSWSYASTELAPLRQGVSPALFPILMWLTCLIVAYFAVERLVITHLKRLRHKLRAFSQTREFSIAPLGASAPSELQELNASFEAMATNVLQDEAQLEDMLFEKNVLLKEVHHRVKNNLQLIASIINMQMRKLETQEARMALRNIQERVLGLATIHQRLYQTDMLTAVPMNDLLREVINQLWNLGVAPESKLTLKTNIDPLILLPDQAVPLSLLLTEAMTNALKHIGVPEGEENGWLEITLTANEDETHQRAELCIANSTGERVTAVNDHHSSGLGQRLLMAFAQQLDAKIETVDEDGMYRVIVRFEVHDFTPDAPVDEVAPEPIEH
ncbi:sensor histidine kinase [Falsihalocynthiibacter sp. SS001]|uniref:sensor histidine kinase n=1 Tax=Falsihalocynthiibacter sp. SS001 TaxID=3349698 RepID=UPI0036D3FC5D